MGLNFLAPFIAPALDFIGAERQREHQSNEADTARHFNAGQQEAVMNFNSAQAAETRAWQDTMRRTQYQTSVADLKAAGLNPMMALPHPAGTPSGATASASQASSSAPSLQRAPLMSAAMQSASQIKVNDATIERTEAEAEKIRAEKTEIEARTPTHAVSIERMRQQVSESIEKAILIQQEVKHSIASTYKLQQETVNLKETFAQISATIRLLSAQAEQTRTLTGKTDEETREIHQRIKANLPAAEAALRELEAIARNLDMPRREQDRAAHDRFTGALGALIRSLTGIGTYIK